MHKWGDPATISNLLLATEEDVVAGGGVGVDRPHGSPAPTPTPAPAPTPAPPLLVVMADVLWMPDQHPALLKDLGVLFSSAPGGPSSASAIVASGLHTGRYVIDAFMRSARASGFCVQKLGEVRVGQAGVQAQDDGAFSLFEPGSEAEDVSEERRRLEETSPSERKRWVLVYTLTLANHCK
ncbi:hypothetical protein DFJ73DRAFT_825218 [Zopfochytrium polystomum]|nr:hypothetical protein DFJ73DRAFT_825218 [Zopfochytrium polystomum]